MPSEVTFEEYVRDIYLVLEAEDFLKEWGHETRHLSNEDVVTFALALGWK